MNSVKRCSCKEKISSVVGRETELAPAVCLELRKIVDALSVPGKGLLAADESPGNFDKKFAGFGIENEENTRRDYRQMLFSAEKSEFSKYISGVILHHETVYQRTSNGVELKELLRERNVIPGIKVDRGLVQLFGTQNETTTDGLDGLRERCVQYKKDGCHFAKWRCAFVLSDTTPSRLAMATNASLLARYASICQSERIVPIVEPELLHSDEHGINRSFQAQQELLSIVFRALNEHCVYLEGMILKPAMVLSGIKSAKKCTPQIVAEHTVTALQRTVPPAMPTVFFLSGGQSDEESVVNLNSINVYEGKKPWTLSFCYGRALQNAPLRVWEGKPENVRKAQETFLERARLCSEASLGNLQSGGSNGCDGRSTEAAE